MASRSQGSKYLAEQRRKKREAEAAKAGDKKTAPKRGKQGVGGSGTIVEGSAPQAKTTKANAGAGARRAAAASASGPPRSVRKNVRNRDTAFRTPTTPTKVAAPTATPSVDIITQRNDAAKKKLAAQKRLASSGKKDAPSGGSSEKGFFGKLSDKIKKATTLTGKPNKRKFQRGARMTPGERRKYDAAVERYEAEAKPALGKKAGGRVGKPAKKAVGMKAGGRVKTAARTSAKKKSPRRP